MEFWAFNVVVVQCCIFTIPGVILGPEEILMASEIPIVVSYSIKYLKDFYVFKGPEFVSVKNIPKRINP